MAVADPIPLSLYHRVGQDQGLLVRSVVQNNIDNMTFVLNDLRDIMGDIQSLVRHIDSVTRRSSRQNRNQRNRTEERLREEREKKDEPKLRGGSGGQDQLERLPQHCQADGSTSEAQCLKSHACPSTSKECRGGRRRIQRSVSNEQKASKRNAKAASKRLSDSLLSSTQTDFVCSSPRHADSLSFSSWRQRKTFRSTSCQEKTLSTTAEICEENTKSKLDFRVTTSHDANELQNTRHDKGGQHVAPEIVASRKPFYFCHAREESTASRGEYDLDTQEARFGQISDASDCDRSLVSPEDSPLRLRNASNYGKRKSAPSGAIAIVHPILKPKPQQAVCPSPPSSPGSDNIPPEFTYYGAQCAKEPPLTAKYQRGKESAFSNVDSDGYEIPVKHAPTNRANVLHSRRLLVYNKSFQPVTPTEQMLYNTLNSQLGTSYQAKDSLHEYIPLTNPESRIHYLNPETFINKSLPGSPIRQCASVSKVGVDSDNASRTENRTPHSRPVYARIAGSPGSTRSSSSAVQQPLIHHYYHSIESDIDSDNNHGLLEGRTLTPDLDWSYLSLVGGSSSRGEANKLGIFRSCGTADNGNIVNGASTPIFRSQFAFGVLASSPNVVCKVPFYHILSSKCSSPPSEPSEGKSSNSVDSPLSPILCDGSSLHEKQDYCGCYEAAMDSVLENLAGYGTLEEAIDNFDSDDILNETYINFDDQFEEDEWDVGLGCEGSPDFAFEFPLIYIEDETSEGSREYLVESSLPMDKILVGRQLSRPNDLALKKRAAPLTPIDNVEHDATSSGERHFSPNELEEYRDETPARAPTGLFLSARPIHNESVHLSEEISNTSFSVSSSSVCKTMSRSSGEDMLDDDRSSNLPDRGPDHPGIMIASYDTSCQAVASGSPMSICSSDAAVTSPMSDCCLITSSEGDDLFTSHEESYFLLSPSSPMSKDTDNALVPRSGRQNRTSTRELTQQFLMSLRDICEKYESASSDGGTSGSSTHDGDLGVEHNLFQHNNNNEDLGLPAPSSSGFPSSSDSSTITASTSTATDATLMQEDVSDDNKNQLNEEGPTARNTISAELCGSSNSSNSSFLEDSMNGGHYNRNVNTWTAFTTLAHVHADDVSDGTASDIIYTDNNLVDSVRSMTSSYIDADNIGSAPDNNTTIY